MIEWNAANDGLVLVADSKGAAVLILAALIILYLVFQAGFWIGRSVGRASQPPPESA